MDIIDISVEEQHGGQRLDRYLSSVLGDYSRAFIQKLMADGHVLLNGLGGTPSKKVKAGDVVRVTIPPAIEAIPQAQDIPLEIVYEDSDLLVLNKPAGLVVHPAAGNHDHTLVNALLAHCGDSLSGIGGVKRPGIVHRLDKETSGLMVVAKNDFTHQGLSAQFADRSLSRTYGALVWGLPKPTSGTIHGAIGRDPRNRQKMAIVAHGGREATTHYTLQKTLGPYVSYVHCKLETGRTHQIRVHMTSIGHGLLGDGTYGNPPRGTPPALVKAVAEKTHGKKRQCLHAFALTLIHPRSGQVMTFECPMPPDIQGIMDWLEAEKI